MVDGWNEAKALSLYKEGKNDVEIAAVFQCSKAYVRKWRQRNGLPTKLTKTTNICLDCGYPIRKCPWLQFGVLAEGTEAYPSILWFNGPKGKRPVATWRIVSCPLFCKNRECIEEQTKRKFRRK